MNAIEDLKKNIGTSVFDEIEKESEKEVALAMKMPLLDQWKKDKYYHPENVVAKLLKECFLFEEKGLKISPLDIFNILFTCKIFLASKTENEYHQRAGGAYFHDEYRFTIPWKDKGTSFDDLCNQYLTRLDNLKKERVLLTQISSFKDIGMSLNGSEAKTSQTFFIELFKKINIPYLPFFDGNHLIKLHKEIEPNLSSYDIGKAKYLFQPPSFGYKTFGSEMYCRLYSSAWLRVFLNMLRISGFIYPGQIDFGQSNVSIIAPTSPVFLSTSTWGGYSWDEDKKEPWSKIPDGCLFLSFGYRGLSEMWIDERTFGGIEKFFIENEKIFECLKNPWSKRNLYDVMPTLDILSSATQIPDTGAKVLQIYCCLEHLFVPKNIVKDNKKYIVGAINALKPELLDWFNELYQLRCMYAHKGFVLRDEKTRTLITTSIQNTMILLVAKLKN
jgi:hypothetical protein